MSQLTVREATLDLFRSAGIDTLFGNPGSTELPLFRDFPDDFRYVLGLQESVVVGMADGYAQARRNAAVVNLHSAVGVGHAAGNIFTAYRNHTPLVITAGQQARALLPHEPYLFAERATEFARPYLKWAAEPARAADVPAALARALAVSLQSPCGPTLVSIPVDDWDEPAEAIAKRTVARTQSANPEQMAEFARRLDGAARPAFVVGAGVARDDAFDALLALAEEHQAAVWVAPLSARCAFPENHPLFAGFLPGDRAAIAVLLAPCDLIAIFGAPAFTYHVDTPGPAVAPGTDLLLLTDDPAAPSRIPQGLAIVGSLRAGLATLLTLSTAPRRPPPPTRPAPAAPAPDRLTDALVCARIAELRPTQSIVVEEAPSSRAAMHAHLPIVARDGFFTCASGGLGHGLPAAIGMALGRPQEKVVALLGDGSAMYAIQGLWSAAQLGLPVTFIILNNRRYAALEHFAQHFGVEPLVGTDLPGLDFVALATAQGCAAARVTAASDLAGALERALSATTPFLLEIVLD